VFLSVPQRNRSVFPLNHKTEFYVKEEYTTMYIYRFDEICEYKNMVCIVKDNLSMGLILNNCFIISCEICTKRVVVR
jgi:hypothetical protein